MTEARNGGDLFIVDNSNSGWTAERYLREWCDVAKSMDIASGFFEGGAYGANRPSKALIQAVGPYRLMQECQR